MRFQPMTTEANTTRKARTPIDQYNPFKQAERVYKLLEQCGDHNRQVKVLNLVNQQFNDGSEQATA